MTYDRIALSTHLAQVTPVLTTKAVETAVAAREANAHLNRIHLATLLLDNDIPQDAVAHVIDWADEPNGDGTYDLDLSEVWGNDGYLTDLGGRGAVPAGHTDGGTDWDIFLIEENGEQVISVEKVYEWVHLQGWTL